jgi:hypothetical protein
LLIPALVLPSQNARSEGFSARAAGKIQSRYVADSGTLIDRNPVYTIDVFLDLNKRFYADIAYIKGFAERSQIKQTQLTVGYRNWLSEKNKIGWNAGTSYLDTSPLFSFKEAGFLNPYLQLHKEFQNGLTPYLRFDTILPVEGKIQLIVKQGRGGLRAGWPIKKDKLVLTQRLGVLYEDIINRDATVTASHDLTVSWTVSKSVSLDLNAVTTVPLNRSRGRDKAQVVPSLSFAYRF